MNLGKKVWGLRRKFGRNQPSAGEEAEVDPGGKYRLYYEAALPLATPWRFVMAAESPGRLLENNFLVLNLNAPCAIQDTSWIRPGKVIREVTLTSSTYADPPWRFEAGSFCQNYLWNLRVEYVLGRLRGSN